MAIVYIASNTTYDEGIHPEVTMIMYRKGKIGSFFLGNRFPNLKELDCHRLNLTELPLECPSLERLECDHNNLEHLRLECPQLRYLKCNHNCLKSIVLNCPFLNEILCDNNPLDNLNGLEFCEDLRYIECSDKLRASVILLKTMLPKIKASFLVDQP